MRVLIFNFNVFHSIAFNIRNWGNTSIIRLSFISIKYFFFRFSHILQLMNILQYLAWNTCRIAPRGYIRLIFQNRYIFVNCICDALISSRTIQTSSVSLSSATSLLIGRVGFRLARHTFVFFRRAPADRPRQRKNSDLACVSARSCVFCRA